jgi:hypothetical protein
VIAGEIAGYSMSNATTISADLINRRLGGGRKNFYESDLPEIADSPSDGSGVSAAFMVKMLTLFVAVVGCTYYFEGVDLSWYEIKQAVGGLAAFGL